ncbi:MAG: histidine phosphatase family protein [Acidobacteriota bacterium]
MGVYLIRHGETAWSLSGQHTGRTDVPLTTHGEEEARALAEPLARVTFSRVFSSPRQRALRTCELAGLAAPVAIDPDLAEWDYGDYEGRRAESIRTERPDWNLFRDGCPDGESPDEVAARVDRVIARVQALPGDIALFTHGHLGRTLCARWIGLDVLHGRQFLLGTASISVLDHDRGGPALVSWNWRVDGQRG